MSGGDLYAGGRFPTIIAMDAGNVFQLSGGTLHITDRAVGRLTINGNFAATGGSVQDDVNTAAGTFGTFQVNGDINLGVQCFFSLWT
jgi:hypothetical protein